MRRVPVALIIPFAVAAVLTACGSGGSPAASANSAVKVSGSFGKAPAVTIPAQKAGSNLVVRTEVQGHGPVLTASEALVGNYVVYIWHGTSHRLALSTFSSAPQLLAGKLLPGLETALRGKQIGSRILAVLPPRYAYGTTGNANLGIAPSDTLVFVVDLIHGYAGNASASGSQVSTGGGALPRVSAKPGSAPTVHIPATSPPGKLVVKTLIKGSGPVITKGQEVATQYIGVNWRTKQVFDSSWARAQPFGFRIDVTPAQIIPGWDKGLLGQRVGSRVLLVIPPADGYGRTGNAQANIKGTDTLVFVVDLLGAFSRS
jgi:FKBP-type peptidyl-prolyl cis-trans isomerase